TKSQKLVQHVTDELLPLGMIQRVLLLGELFDDNIPNFVFDLRARHLIECLKIDEVEQALVKFDLQIRVQVAFGERARIADGDQSMFLARALPPPIINLVAADRLADLPHDYLSKSSAAAMPAFNVSRSLPSALFRLSSSMGTPRSIADRIS